MKRAIAVLALGSMIGLLAGGCGGSKSEPPLTKAEYVKQMTAIGRSLSTSMSSLGAPTSPKSAATALSKVQDDLRTAAKQLDDITPPDDVKDAHEKLTSGVNDFADGLDPIIEKLNNGDAKTAAAIAQLLSQVTTLKGFTEIQNAAASITKAGYKING
jgi:hypothetical protein